MILYCEQRSDEWLAAKMGRPSASNAAKILSSTGKKSDQQKGYLYELVAERAGHTVERFSGSDPMNEGIEREGESRDAYAFVTGQDVQQVGLIICDATGAACSPDGLISRVGGLEAKNPLPKTFFSVLDSKGIPSVYIPQMQASLAITGRDWWDYVCYLSGETPIIRRMERDKDTELMAQALADFCGELDETCRRLGVPLLPQLELKAA